uniref:Hypothetical chloroplast RF66 n=1 Tax=Prasinoderma coloniale TaxID=156133 RepID=A0A088CJ45_9VIRI|nr:hypothetical chloroplast RF66 [Prasinoderma coloniale]AID67576.1 hypothetical chloroplast RF66 [Prasinoderma coloniale]
MINVILYPTIFIGIFLIGWAITLYTLQFVQPTLAKESDIILSTITSLCGGILFFQGWRLDPLLFTCYILLVVTIILLSLELLQLRSLQNPVVSEMNEKEKFFTTRENSATSSVDEKTKKYSSFLNEKLFKPRISEIN